MAAEIHISEYDKRQFEIMILKINAFKDGKLPFSDLIYDLEALLNLIEITDDKWRVEFRGHWWDLEQVYAYALEKNKSFLDSEEEKIVFEAIENLLELIQIKLKLYPKDEALE